LLVMRFHHALSTNFWLQTLHGKQWVELKCLLRFDLLEKLLVHCEQLNPPPDPITFGWRLLTPSIEPKFCASPLSSLASQSPL